jgi:DNA-binding transcriptional LysR family regulator
LLDSLLDDAQRLELTRAGQTRSVAVRGSVRCSNGVVVAALYEQGLGIGEVVEFLVHDALAAGRPVPILRAWRRAPMAVHALHPPAR